MSSTGATVEEGYDDGDGTGLSGFYILIIFLVVLTAFAGVVYIAYQRGAASRAAEGTLPTVVADPRPVVSEVGLEPADPTRQEVYDELVENPATRVVAEANPAEDPLTGFDTTPPAATITPPPEATRVADVTPPPAATPTPAQTPAVTEPRVSPPPAAATTPRPTPAPQPAETVSPPPSAQPATVASGNFAVQVGAFGSSDEALEFYGALVGKHGSVIGNQSPSVNRATVNGRDFHRLWLGNFSSRPAAEAYCNEIKARVSCYVQKG